jgi:hypothetical protein
MSSDQYGTPNSPVLLAIGISCAIALGSVIATLDYAQVEDVVTGQFLTRPLTEGQLHNAAAIARLEQTVGAVSKDIDFVTERVSTSMRRSESQTVERLAGLEAEIATLKNQLAGIQHARVAVPAAAPAPIRTEPLFSAAMPNDMFDMSSLRSSLNDLGASHTSAIAAITKRLDKIETQIGGSTDTAPVADSTPTRRKVVTPRKAAPAAQPVRQDLMTDRNAAPALKPAAPLRLSKLPG